MTKKLENLYQRLYDKQELLSELITETVDLKKIDKKRLHLFKTVLEGVHESIGQAIKVIDSQYSLEPEDFITHEYTNDHFSSEYDLLSEENREEERQSQHNFLEGVFDGENMIGADGKVYSVPANYASKSKLVEGDILKLTILPNGAFKYKQINPIARKRLMGTLIYDSDLDRYFAFYNGRRWNILTASVTFFKGKAYDDIIFLVPHEGMSKWAAVETIISHDDADNSHKMSDFIQKNRLNSTEPEIIDGQDIWPSDSFKKLFYEGIASLDEY